MTATPTPPPRAAPPRRVLWILAIASLLVAGGFGELAVRWLAPQAYTSGEHFYRADPELGWTLQPGYRGRFSNLVDFDSEVRTNSLGLRGPEVTGRRPAVLGIGDSFMFGHGVDEAESFLAVAAKSAGATPINAGVPGYDLCQATDLAARVLAQVSVDAIAVAPCLANDEIDVALGRQRTLVRHGYFVEPGSDFDPGSWRRRARHVLFAHSHLVRLARFSALTEWLSARLGGGESINRRALRALLAAYQVPVDPQVLEGDRLTGECLDRLARLGEEHGIPVVALLIPDELEVIPEKFAVATRAVGEPDLRFDAEGPRRRISRLLAAAGIPVVDPTAELTAMVARGEKPWFSQDRHFTAAGSRVVGELLGRELTHELAARPADGAVPDPTAPGH